MRKTCGRLAGTDPPLSRLRPLLGRLLVRAQDVLPLLFVQRLGPSYLPELSSQRLCHLARLLVQLGATTRLLRPPRRRQLRQNRRIE